MKKDAFYFPHYSIARNDSKLLKLRRVLGIEGYGIYFMLLEILREQTDFRLPIKVVDELEFDLRVSKEKILSVINGFDLFEVDESFFFSPKLVLYLQPYIEKSERARSAVLTRWNKIKGIENTNVDTNVMQMNNKSNTNDNTINKVNKRDKVNKVFTPPTLDEVKLFFKEKGYSEVTGSTAFYYYDSANWVDSNGNKIKNWKQKMIGVWFKEEAKLLGTKERKMVM
jgi:hypothetical protein